MIRASGKTKKILPLLTRNPNLLFKILHSKIKVLLRPLPKGCIRKRIYGVLFEFDFDSELLLDNYEFSQPAIKSMYFDAYEPLTIEVMKRFLRTDDTFIDAGANIGFLSAVAAGLVGKNGQVHGFEPVPQYYQRLEKLSLMNHDYTIVPNQCALGDRRRTANIHINCSNIGGHTMVPNYRAGETEKESFEVPVVRLDWYIKEQGLDRVSLIKIDTEGFEFPVLKGLQGYFEETHRRPAIICEIDPWAYPLLGYTLVQLSEYMKKYDYRAFELTNTEYEVDVANLATLTNVLFTSGNV